MALKIVDMLSSILESITFAYIIIYCVDIKSKINKRTLLFLTLSLTIESQFFTGTFGDNYWMTVFLTHIIALGVIIAFYRKNIVSALTAFTIIYCILEMYSILFGNLIFEYIKTISPIEYINYETIFIIYIPEWIAILLCFKYIEKIKQINKFIMDEKFYIVFFIISFFLDFIVTFYLMTLSKEIQLLKNITYIIFFMLSISIVVYFWNIHQKSKQIYKLNEDLKIKNNELKKIKNDYGSQISYLYGLGLMKRFGDLKKILKDSIDNNESTPTAIDNNNKTSLLSLALKPAIDKGIHVIMEDKCDFGLINMKEMELYRVISNIVNNAIKAMKGQGIIIAKSYEYLGNAIVIVENNGPKIEEHYLTDIFKAGFTTKDNTDKSHGYGLSIVKDLIESHNGKIHVKSTDTATEFKIVLPIK